MDTGFRTRNFTQEPLPPPPPRAASVGATQKWQNPSAGAATTPLMPLSGAGNAEPDVFFYDLPQAALSGRLEDSLPPIEGPIAEQLLVNAATALLREQGRLGMSIAAPQCNGLYVLRMSVRKQQIGLSVLFEGKPVHLAVGVKKGANNSASYRLAMTLTQLDLDPKSLVFTSLAALVDFFSINRDSNGLLPCLLTRRVA